MQELWKVAFGLAGLGAVAAFVVWSLYRDWLRLPIFQQMTKAQQFRAFVLLLVLIFLFGLAGLGTYAYVATSTQSSKSSPSLSSQTKTILQPLVDPTVTVIIARLGTLAKELDVTKLSDQPYKVEFAPTQSLLALPWKVEISFRMIDRRLLVDADVLSHEGETIKSETFCATKALAIRGNLPFETDGFESGFDRNADEAGCEIVLQHSSFPIFSLQFTSPNTCELSGAFAGTILQDGWQRGVVFCWPHNSAPRISKQDFFPGVEQAFFKLPGEWGNRYPFFKYPSKDFPGEREIQKTQ